jgi:membrane carboxypeptidase/penicillin-binding protein PbpC
MDDTRVVVLDRRAPALDLGWSRTCAARRRARPCATCSRGASRSASRPPRFAWKTGTSAGQRDAWAVGFDERHAAGVWIGRFAGGGDAAFVGERAAEPLLTRVFLELAR